MWHSSSDSLYLSCQLSLPQIIYERLKSSFVFLLNFPAINLVQGRIFSNFGGYLM